MNFPIFPLDAGADPSGAGNLPSLLSFALPILILVVVFYFFLYRPQKKQEKEVRDMRNSIEIGDVVSTNGGIVGVVVTIKEDMLLIESGADRTKIQIQKWAIHSVLSQSEENTK